MLQTYRVAYRADLDAYINDPELHRPGLAKGQKVRRSSSTDEK